MKTEPSKRELRVVSDASELEASERYCTLCGQRLASKIAWLEKDTRSNFYTDDGSIAPDFSQGWFPFGIACARKQVMHAEFVTETSNPA